MLTMTVVFVFCRYMSQVADVNTQSNIGMFQFYDVLISLGACFVLYYCSIYFALSYFIACLTFKSCTKGIPTYLNRYLVRTTRSSALPSDVGVEEGEY